LKGEDKASSSLSSNKKKKRRGGKRFVEREGGKKGRESFARDKKGKSFHYGGKRERAMKKKRGKPGSIPGEVRKKKKVYRRKKIRFVTPIHLSHKGEEKEIKIWKRREGCL